MTLRKFHLAFIGIAIAACLATSFRSFQLAQMQTAMPFESMGGASLFFALALMGYAGWCLKRRATFRI